MAGISEPRFDFKRTIVVQNVPSCISDEDLTIHFQKAKYGGGDVDKVARDGSIVFVAFDSAEGMSQFTQYILHKVKCFPFMLDRCRRYLFNFEVI